MGAARRRHEAAGHKRDPKPERPETITPAHGPDPAGKRQKERRAKRKGPRFHRQGEIEGNAKAQ
ncbi:hypothetical protein MACH21_12260 [Roseicyclus marinus]|uniref:Uncharacterized protein n=1 Tax=Roseicyclus marinus TaxID=2161673 RepID=A0AA48KIC9_9RHOB|nr:hypothetical protein MACH21_12260 [Roseicyclus marinus]